MKKVLAAIVTFIFSVCLISATVATASAASVKKVSNFKASATPVAVTLTWKKASGAKGYEIQQKSGKKWKKVATIKKAKTTSYTVKKLKNGTTYQFRIRAVNGKKKSAYVSVKVKTGVEKMKSVSAVSTGLKSAKITWEKANVTGYEIQRKVGKKWKSVKKIKKAKTTYLNVSNLTAGAKNTFRIRGYVSGSAKTYYGAYTTVNVTTSVASMKSVGVKSVTDTAVTVGWTKLSGVSGYQVQKLVAGKWVDVNAAVKNSVTQYNVTGLAALTNQQIRVRAYQKDGKKTYYNNWVTINAKTNIGKVSGVSYTGLTASSVKVSWKAAGGATGYRVFNNNVKIADVKTTYADLKINAGATHKITVVPYASGVTGTATSPITFTSPCAKVAGLKVSAIAETSATVAWNAANGATSYQLQYCKNGVWSPVIPVTGTSYVVNDLTANTSYTFKIRALNKNGTTVQYGAFSDLATASTKGLGEFTTNTVSWNTVAGASYYEVEYYNEESCSWEIAETNITSTSYEDAEICGDESRLFRVTAYDNSGKEIYKSNTASTKISDVSFSIKDNIITASWSKFDGASSYAVRIKSRGMSDKGATVITATDSKRSVTSNRLAPGLIYEVAITAVKGGNTVELASFALKASDFVATDKTNKGINDQLLYLVEAINRSKYDTTKDVTVRTTPYNLTQVKYVDFGIQGADEGFLAGAKQAAVKGLLNLLFENPESKYKGCKIENGFLKCTDAESIDGVFATRDANGNIKESMAEQVIGGKLKIYSFQNGKYGSYTLEEIVQPAGNNEDNLAFIYNGNNINAWKNGFSSVVTEETATGYRISATLKTETTPNYHNGFVASASLKDMGDMGLGNAGKASLDSYVGQTTIVAEINEDCLLTYYKIKSPYKYDMKVEVSLSSDEMNMDGGEKDATADALGAVLKLFEKIVIEMNTKVEGCQEYEYSFSRVKY